MAEVAREHDGAIAVERRADAARDAVLAVDREQPVAVDAEHEGRRRDAGSASSTPPRSRPTSCEFIASTRRDVRVRVEPAREPVAVEVEVRLDREASAVAQRAHARLPRALEALVQLGGRAVVQQRHPPGECEAAVRAVAVGRVVVLAALEPRVDVDRLQLHGVQRDLVCRVHRGSRQDADARDAIGAADGPLQRVHAAHRAADHGRPRVDAEGVGQTDLRGDLVADRQVGEAGSPLVAVRRDARGAGRSLAAAEHVRRDDEPAVGVDRRAGPTMSSHQPSVAMPGRGRARAHGCRRSGHAAPARRCRGRR